jgi:hypothetical protein
VAVRLVAVEGDGGVRRVDLELARGAGRLGVERGAGGGSLVLRIDAPDACALPARLPCDQAPVERLLEDLLALPAADPLYEHALARAATLLGGAVPD